MRLYALLAIYLTAALSLAGGVVAGLVALTGPVGSEPSRPPLSKIASADPGRQVIVEPHQQAFRYGPEINHGPSDAPVNARQQALKEARALAPTGKIKRPRIRQQDVMHHRPMTRESGLTPDLTPSVPSTGH
jgi:hypothetical protein